MKILSINKYFFIKGGAEKVFLETANLFQKKGHSVSFFSMEHKENESTEYSKYFCSNIDYDKPGLANKIRVSLKLLYSFEAKNKLKELLKNETPDLAHLHNIYHQLTPSILHVLKKNKIPIIMTIHDCKLVCASYSMMAKGKVCEACKGRKYYNCLLNRCLKNSFPKSFLATLEMYLHHKILNVYNLVDIFLSPSLFLVNKIQEMGFNRDIEYLPNSVKMENYLPSYDANSDYLVYFGRLSNTKGLFTLIKAVKDLDIKLKIIGEGPIRKDLELFIQENHITNVELLGYKKGEELKNIVKKSIAVVLPSECYENNPLSIIEAFASGKPVIGSNIGGIPELVKDGETGYLFDVGNHKDLKEKIKLLLSDLNKCKQMGKNARKFIEENMNEEIYYSRLLNFYKRVL